MPLCLGGHAYCGVRRRVLLVAADAPDDFEEEPVLEGLRAGVQEFAGFVAVTARRKSATGNRPCPGKFLKWRLQDSGSIARRGASASWTKKIRPAGDAAMVVSHREPMKTVQDEAE